MIKRMIAAACMAVLAGCGMQGQLADQLTSFNEAQQMAADQVLLLNILRSRLREPRAYSRFDVIRGSESVSPGLTLAIPFGPGAGHNNLSTGANFSAGISHDVKPQDDQDFYRGILTPIKPETWALYQDQNWPPSLLFHLFAEDISIEQRYFDAVIVPVADKSCAQKQANDEVQAHCNAWNAWHPEHHGAVSDPCQVLEQDMRHGKNYYIVSNDPRDECAMRRFDSVIDALVILGFNFKQKPPERVGPPVPARALQDTKWISSFKDNGYDIEPADAKHKQYFVTRTGGFAATLLRLPSLPEIAVAGVSGTSPLPIRITTRSADEIIYYLGEVQRVADPVHDGDIPRRTSILTGHGERDLLAITDGSVADPAVRVHFDGKTYSVPRYGRDMTLESFELVRQVFALYNKASTTPSTTAVTVVN